MALTAKTCGGDIGCTDRHGGEVSGYLRSRQDKALALALANDAKSFAIAAPGASFKAPAQLDRAAR